MTPATSGKHSLSLERAADSSRDDSVTFAPLTFALAGYEVPGGLGR